MGEPLRGYLITWTGSRPESAVNAILTDLVMLAKRGHLRDLRRRGDRITFRSRLDFLVPGRVSILTIVLARIRGELSARAPRKVKGSVKGPALEARAS